MKVPANLIRSGDFLSVDNLQVVRIETGPGVVRVYDAVGAHVTYLCTEIVLVADRG